MATDAQGLSGQKNYTYTGTGGVPVGSPLNRFLYAVKFRELNILLSGAINSHSKILYDRQPLAPHSLLESPGSPHRGGLDVERRPPERVGDAAVRDDAHVRALRPQLEQLVRHGVAE